jgi:hypothetical protein
MNGDKLLYVIIIASIIYINLRPHKCGYHDGKPCGYK